MVYESCHNKIVIRNRHVGNQGQVSDLPGVLQKHLLRRLSCEFLCLTPRLGWASEAPREFVKKCQCTGPTRDLWSRNLPLGKSKNFCFILSVF